MPVEGVTFSQLCCDRAWKRTMAATCIETVVGVVGSSGDHVRDVAMIVAVKKVERESDIYFFKRPDYTAEEWRWLFLTAGSGHYLHSVRFLGFCGVAGINWAVVTRMSVSVTSLRMNITLLLCRKMPVPFCITCARSSDS